MAARTRQSIPPDGGENNQDPTIRDQKDLTAGQTGLFFFDTKDKNEPTDSNSDGLFKNLTPDVRIQGGSYTARGFIYLNSELFTSNGSPGQTSTFTMPGEPFGDTDGNGRWDSDESWINLNYSSPDPANDDTIRGSAVDAYPLANGAGSPESHRPFPSTSTNGSPGIVNVDGAPGLPLRVNSSEFR